MIHKYGGYINDKNDFSTRKYLTCYIKYYKLDIIKVIKGMLNSSKVLNNEMSKKDNISCITELDVPILLISGEEDMVCPVPAAEKWFDNLNAPKKEFVKITNVSHMVNFEQAKEWNKLLINLSINL